MEKERALGGTRKQGPIGDNGMKWKSSTALAMI